MLPVRCFTCLKVIGNTWGTYCHALQSGKTEAEALEQCNIRRICCRRMLLSHVDIVDEIMRYESRPNCVRQTSTRCTGR